MIRAIPRKQLTTEQLESTIMERLVGHSEFANISQVNVKSTRNRPPQETWEQSTVVRRSGARYVSAERDALLGLLKGMKMEFDLVSDLTP
jgi:hypothetical protein